MNRISLGVSAAEVLSLQGNSVYFKNENLDIYFVDLDWIREEGS